jgi:hypothetical protein
LEYLNSLMTLDFIRALNMFRTLLALFLLAPANWCFLTDDNTPRRAYFVAIKFEFTFLPQYSTFARSYAHSSYVLLRAPRVLSELKLEKRSDQINGLVKQYCHAMRLDKAGKLLADSKDADYVEAKFGEVLSQQQIRQLRSFDNYLSIRSGYIGDRKNIDADRDRSDKIKEIRRVSLKDGLEAWKETLLEIEAICNESSNVNGLKLTDFTYPVWSDLTLNGLAEENKKKIDELLQDLPDNGSYEEYRVVFGREIIYALGDDGLWELTIRDDDRNFVKAFDYLILKLNEQSAKVGSNELDILPEQFTEIERLRSDWIDAGNEIDKRQQMRRSTAGDNDSDYKFFEKERAAAGIKWHEEVWDQVLLPIQRDWLIEASREFYKKKFGLLAYLQQVYPDEPKKMERIRKRLEQYQKKLFSIEEKGLAEIFSQVKESLETDRLGEFSRPPYLIPSLQLMEWASEGNR